MNNEIKKYEGKKGRFEFVKSVSNYFKKIILFLYIRKKIGY